MLFDDTEIAFKAKSKKDLKRAYWLFKLVSSYPLVKVGSFCLQIALFLRLPIRKIIKSTIFEHFCGGESITDCDKTIQELGKYQIGTILDYSVEGQENEDSFDSVMKETLTTINKAAQDDHIPFCVFKATGMGRFHLFEKINKNQILTESEKKEFEKIFFRIEKICQKAHDLNVPVFIDAEESWIQNAIDDLANKMMQKFNKEKIIVYNTLQMYRWDRLAYLKQCHADAVNKNYFLGLKIVRGAYMEKERSRAKEMNYKSPIQKDKANTDKDYDLAIAFCLNHIDRISICAGTHNENSTTKLCQLMREHKIENQDTRIYFSQLLGMSDHLSYNLSHNSYKVAKYVPYGPVKKVIPYLIRRAEENTSISGQTSRELSLIIKERARRNV